MLFRSKLFKALELDYTSIDLDSVAYQTDNKSQRIRAVLAARTGSPTIPQIFIGGELVGGSTDLLAMHDRGELLPRLQELKVAVRADVDIVAESLLPGWIQPRRQG